MSDRTLLIDQPTGANGEAVQMFMDGESGTWRLFFVHNLENVDFSLAGLREFHAALSDVLRDIESDPETYNAEVRRGWGS